MDGVFVQFSIPLFVWYLCREAVPSICSQSLCRSSFCTLLRQSLFFPPAQVVPWSFRIGFLSASARLFSFFSSSSSSSLLLLTLSFSFVFFFYLDHSLTPSRSHSFFEKRKKRVNLLTRYQSRSCRSGSILCHYRFCAHHSHIPFLCFSLLFCFLLPHLACSGS